MLTWLANRVWVVEGDRRCLTNGHPSFGWCHCAGHKLREEGGGVEFSVSGMIHRVCDGAMSVRTTSPHTHTHTYTHTHIAAHTCHSGCGVIREWHQQLAELSLAQLVIHVPVQATPQGLKLWVAQSQAPVLQGTAKRALPVGGANKWA